MRGTWTDALRQVKRAYFGAIAANLPDVASLLSAVYAYACSELGVKPEGKISADRVRQRIAVERLLGELEGKDRG